MRRCAQDIIVGAPFNIVKDLKFRSAPRPRKGRTRFDADIHLLCQGLECKIDKVDIRVG